MQSSNLKVREKDINSKNDGSISHGVLNSNHSIRNNENTIQHALYSRSINIKRKISEKH